MTGCARLLHGRQELRFPIGFGDQRPVDLELTAFDQRTRRKAGGIDDRDVRVLLANLLRQCHAMEATGHEHVSEEEVQRWGARDHRQGGGTIHRRQDRERFCRKVRFLGKI